MHLSEIEADLRRGKRDWKHSIYKTKPCHDASDTDTKMEEGGAQMFFSTFATESSNIEKVISGLVDVLADEVRYCASVFRPPKSVTNFGGNPCHEKMTSEPEVAAEAAKLKTNSRDSSLKSPEFHGGNHANKVSKVAPSTSDSSSISAEGSAYSPVKVSANSASGTNTGVMLTGRCPNLETIDMRTTVTAIRRFVLEVYYPFLLSAKQNARNDSMSADRIRISTLLAIREMLILNAGKLFSFPNLHRSPSETAEKDRSRVSYVFASTIVRNTAKRIQSHHPESNFLDDFAQATRNYYAKSEDFQLSLEEADVRSTYFNSPFHSDGVKLGQEKSILAKVSYNYARARHPLLCHKNVALEDSHPAPTACAVFQIESEAACVEIDEEFENLESLKKVLRRKYK